LVGGNLQKFVFSDALFTAASAFSDTGLVVTTTYNQFSFFGQTVILFLILLGGIGVMAIKVMFWIAVGKKIGLHERLLIQSERGSSKIGGTYELIITAVQVIFLFIFIGVILLVPYFYLVPQTGMGAENVPYGDFGKSVYHAVFHTVSAINNAGFDITGSASLAPYANDIYVQVIFIILLVAGGIGFPVF
jgi:Trk-type K+ transport system membrane component